MLASVDAERSSSSPVVLEDPAHLSVTGYKQTIADFLAKPHLLSTVTINTASVSNTLLWSTSILSALKANPVWMNKLAGSAQIKATAVVTVQVNASPYNAGALILHFIPNREHNVVAHSTRSTLMQKSQQPNMRIDIAEKKEISMEIPYVSPTEYCDIASGIYDWGTVFLSSWADFTTGTAAPSSCTATIWLSFIDVDIQNPVVPQGEVKKGQRGRVKPFDRKPPMPTEQEKGPVSKVLSAVSIMAGTLSTIPTLAPIAGPVSWFTNVASGVASAFGWSKPLNDNFGSRMVEGAHFGAPNCNGIDQSQPLSLFADNKVRVMSDLSGDGLDHMSINYLKSIPSYFTTFDLNYSDTVGLKRTIDLAPYVFGFGRNIGMNGASPVYAISVTPICLLGRLFSHWRGSVVLRFHIHKTQFHTGRIMFAFSPAAGAAPSIANTAYLHRAIVDLSLTNEACLTFPYLGVADYIETDTPIGSCHIYVINPLRGPDAVSSRVQVTVEVSGGPDLEFQVPRPIGDQPIVAQMGDSTSTEPSLCVPIGASTPGQDILGASQYTIGEHTTTLLQLLKRYAFCKFPGSAFPSGSFGVRLFPFTCFAHNLTGTTLTTQSVGGDYYSLFSSMFAYSRGGIRYRFVTSDANQMILTWLTYSNNKTYSVATNDPSLTIHGNMGIFAHRMASGGASVQVPHYGKTYARLNHLATPSSGYGPDSPNLNLVVTSTNGVSANNPNFLVQRAVADDFQFSYFIGIPDLVTGP